VSSEPYRVVCAVCEQVLSTDPSMDEDEVHEAHTPVCTTVGSAREGATP